MMNVQQNVHPKAKWVTAKVEHYDPEDGGCVNIEVREEEGSSYRVCLFYRHGSGEELVKMLKEAFNQLSYDMGR